MFVLKSKLKEVEAERDALKDKLARYTKGLAQGTRASAEKRRRAAALSRLAENDAPMIGA